MPSDLGLGDASEHTSAFTGYMEGAIRSGERAAAEIADAGP